MKICKYIDSDGIACLGEHHGHGYCRKHLDRVRKHGDPSIVLHRRSPLAYPIGKMPLFCTKDGCEERAHRKGLCDTHYIELREWGENGRPQRYEICPDCKRRRYLIHLGRGLCSYCFNLVRSQVNNIRHEKNFWDRNTCLKAGQVWYETTGQVPLMTDWAVVGLRGKYPSRSVVVSVFGSWRNFMAELDVPQPQRGPSGRPIICIYDCLIGAVVYIDLYGHIPSMKLWIAAQMSPSATTIRKRFGSWTAFTSTLSNITGLSIQSDQEYRQYRERHLYWQ